MKKLIDLIAIYLGVYLGTLSVGFFQEFFLHIRLEQGWLAFAFYGIIGAILPTFVLFILKYVIIDTIYKKTDITPVFLTLYTYAAFIIGGLFGILIGSMTPDYFYPIILLAYILSLIIHNKYKIGNRRSELGTTEDTI